MTLAGEGQCSSGRKEVGTYTTKGHDLFGIISWLRTKTKFKSIVVGIQQKGIHAMKRFVQCMLGSLGHLKGIEPIHQGIHKLLGTSHWAAGRSHRKVFFPGTTWLALCFVLRPALLGLRGLIPENQLVKRQVLIEIMPTMEYLKT